MSDLRRERLEPNSDIGRKVYDQQVRRLKRKQARALVIQKKGKGR